MSVVGGGGGGATVRPAARGARQGPRGRRVQHLQPGGALAVRRAVDLTGMPAIPQLHPASMGLRIRAIAACHDVASSASCPMLVQLDHATDEACIEAALAAGVHGVLADGGRMPPAENMA